MMLRDQYQKSLSFILLAALTACGGGGSESSNTSPTASASPSTTTPTPVVSPPATTDSMVMSCVDGSSYQCSGSSIIRNENGVALTSSGVQVYGKSTNDLVTPIADVTSAYGLTLASGGIADLRVSKDDSGAISGAAMVLNNFGISFDGVHERPPIIEAFKTTQGRTLLAANGAIAFDSLPDSSDLNYYDFATKGVGATQANYANNQYFPRSAPARCPAGMMPCPDVETAGIHYTAGDWRTGGNTPDLTAGTRDHGDGDIQAGNGNPDAKGNPTFLGSSTAPGVPFAGTKGARDLTNWSFQYGNLSAWKTKDTVGIADWGASDEHNQNRRGLVAFGKVTDPSIIPTTGTASYSGFVYGWYARNATEDAALFRGNAEVTVDFATRKATIKILNTVADFNSSEQFSTAVPIVLTSTTVMGAVGNSAANYLTGAAETDTLKGGISGRYFGPVVSSGTSGAGPAEIGGAFSLSDSTSGQAVIGGFIGRKQ